MPIPEYVLEEGLGIVVRYGQYGNVIISLHKTENEDIIAKEHFQTRIWESIEL